RASAPASVERSSNIVQAAMRESEVQPPPPAENKARERTPESNLPVSGTVVLDVEQGGIEVPTFVGKTFRGAVEAAQDAGLELDAVGSGVARMQNPAPGTHVASGAHVMVQFGR